MSSPVRELEEVQEEHSIPPEKIMTVSQLNSYISGEFEEDDKLCAVYLLGEVSNLFISSNDHMFFDLKDEGAKISCVLFMSRRKNLEFEPEEGKKILVQGDVEYYEREGKVSIKPVKIYPVGEGIYYKKLKKLKKKLKEEGLFKEENKTPIPVLPERIGIVTSKGGDALRDMVNSIHRRFPNVDIYVKHASVQGENAPEEICEGIKFFDKESDVDVILTGRGGGSIEDLQAFNKEKVTRTIFKTSTPVITGIGHREDETLTGCVADSRCITPTEAGKKVVQKRTKLEDRLRELERQVSKAFEKFKKIKKPEKEVEEGKKMKVRYRVTIAILVVIVLLLLWWFL